MAYIYGTLYSLSCVKVNKPYQMRTNMVYQWRNISQDVKRQILKGKCNTGLSEVNCYFLKQTELILPTRHRSALSMRLWICWLLLLQRANNLTPLKKVSCVWHKTVSSSNSGVLGRSIFHSHFFQVHSNSKW